MAKNPAQRPACTANVGTLIDAGTVVRVMCESCGQWHDLDLPAVAARLGRDFDLWGRRPRCKLTPGCPGRAYFMHGAQGVMRHMRDPDRPPRR